jgi:hypothetical protein
MEYHPIRCQRTGFKVEWRYHSFLNDWAGFVWAAFQVCILTTSRVNTRAITAVIGKIHQ